MDGHHGGYAAQHYANDDDGELDPNRPEPAPAHPTPGTGACARARALYYPLVESRHSLKSI